MRNAWEMDTIRTPKEKGRCMCVGLVTTRGRMDGFPSLRIRRTFFLRVRAACWLRMVRQRVIQGVGRDCRSLSPASSPYVLGTPHTHTHILLRALVAESAGVSKPHTYCGLGLKFGIKDWTNSYSFISSFAEQTSTHSLYPEWTR